MKNRKRLKEILPVLILLIFAVTLVSVFGLIEKLINRAGQPQELLSYTETGDDSVYYNNQWYAPREKLQSLLVIGTDSEHSGDKDRKSTSQADFIALLIIDKSKESFRLMHINRDTVTDITRIDENGMEYGVFSAQLALAQSFGAGEKMQCRNTVSAVENLLYGIEIDHYVSFTMDAVPVINDSIGPVSVKLKEDFTILGEEFTKGAQVTLTGDQALTFVRWRNSDAQSSNLERMERQRAYISALFEKYTASQKGNTIDAMLKVSEYMVSDCSANQLASLAELLSGYAFEGTHTLPGETALAGGYVEYHIDEEQAQKAVIDIFYQPKEK